MSSTKVPRSPIGLGLLVVGLSILLVGICLGGALLFQYRLSGTNAPSPTVAPAIVSAGMPTAAPSNTPSTSPTPVPTNTSTVIPTVELGTSNVFIEYILDASGSMTETLSDGSSKIDVAKQVLTDHMRSFRPETNIGLRAYGHRLPYQQEAESCQDIELIAPVEKGQMEQIVGFLRDFEAQGMTPLTASLQQAKQDFTFEAPRVNSIVMLSDGIETCGGDPCQLVEDLKAQGINFTIHVIGLNVDDQTKEQLSCIARVGGGTYHDARSQQDLGAVLNAVKTTVTEDEMVVPPGLDTPTPVPPTPTITPTPMPPTPTVAPTPPAALPPGTYSLVGYYVAVEETAWDESRVCDNFVVVDGSQDLIREFLDLIDGGNSVNTKNSLNQPEISLDLGGLSPSDTEQIKTSTADQPIQLIVSRVTPRGVGALVCYSMVEIIDVVPPGDN